MKTRSMKSDLSLFDHVGRGGGGGGGWFGLFPYPNSQAANQKRDLLSCYPTILSHWPDMPPYHNHHSQVK